MAKCSVLQVLMALVCVASPAYSTSQEYVPLVLTDTVVLVVAAVPPEEAIEVAAQNAPETENYWTGGISPLFYSVRVRHYRKSIEYFLDLCGFHELEGQPYFKYHRGTA